MSYTPNGKAVTKFSLAVNRRTKDAQGQPATETQWFNVVAWERLAETCNSYLRKGSKVCVEGRIASRKYEDKEHVTREAWEVTITDMEMLSPKDAGAGSDAHAGEGEAEGVPF